MSIQSPVLLAQHFIVDSDMLVGKDFTISGRCSSLNGINDIVIKISEVRMDSN